MQRQRKARQRRLYPFSSVRKLKNVASYVEVGGLGSVRIEKTEPTVSRIENVSPRGHVHDGIGNYESLSYSSASKLHALVWRCRRCFSLKYFVKSAIILSECKVAIEGLFLAS